MTFKPNCPDIRNSKVFDLISDMLEYEIDVEVHDPLVQQEYLLGQHGIKLVKWEDVLTKRFDVVILSVPHDFYLEERLPESTLFVDLYSAKKDQKADFCF